MKSIVSILSVVAALTAVSSASAEDLSLHFAAGGAEQLHMSDASKLFSGQQFQLGETASVKPMFALSPNLAIGPEASAMYFQPSPNTNQPSVLWHFGLNGRIQGNRDAGWSPYLDVGAGGSVVNQVWNPSLTAAVGMDFSLDETNTMWAGPVLGVVHAFDVASTQTALTPNAAFNAVTLGLSLSFDAPVHPRTVTNTVVHETRVQVPAPPAPPCPPPVTRTLKETVPQLSEQVQFQRGSSVLDTTAQTLLNGVATKLNAAPLSAYSVVVEGAASAEGNSTRNLTLSKARANAVSAYLAAHGVASTRLLSGGVGAVGEPLDASKRVVVFFVVKQ